MSPHSLFPVHELLAEEVQAWTERERARHAGTPRAALLHRLAEVLEVDDRQLYRYMSGETPFPLKKAAALCRAIGSCRLLEMVCQDAGLLAELRPDVGALTGYDLVVEQSRSLKEFGELTAAFADSIERKPTDLDAARIEKEGREAIQQIERLIRIARELAERREGRR